MSSLLTNTSAMVALQTLRSINTNLEQTNNRVSTGLRVNTAADNAAYWSIATTIKSDNGALGAVTDSLSLGASTLSTTYTGLDTAKTSLNDLKNQLTTATGENVDKAKIQQTIASIQAQLKSVADAASFSGQNWLSTGTEHGTTCSKTIVSSLSRDSSNQLTDRHDRRRHQPTIRLYGNGSTQFGILDKTIDLITLHGGQRHGGDGRGGCRRLCQCRRHGLVHRGAERRRGITVNINQTTLANAGLSDTKIRSNADLAAVLNQALSDAGISGITASVDGTDHVIFSSLDDFDIGGAHGAGTDTLDVDRPRPEGHRADDVRGQRRCDQRCRHRHHQRRQRPPSRAISRSSTRPCRK